MLGEGNLALYSLYPKITGFFDPKWCKVSFINRRGFSIRFEDFGMRPCYGLRV